jgi:hypothetical protein
MKRIGVSGSWRLSCPELEQDLEREVKQILDDGNGIVTGGALGVDYLATKLALDYSPDGSRVDVIIPTSLETYAEHYRKRAVEGVITSDQAETLIRQLETVNKLGSLTAMMHIELNPDSYFDRNTAVVKKSDELLAFQVNQSAGVQDSVEKARANGVPVKLFSYMVAD